MIVGVPKEIKTEEHRVALTPMGVRDLVQLGSRVIIEKQAGSGVGFHDADYIQAGAEIVASAEDVFNQVELIIKVKEPQAEEISLLKPGHVLFTFLHLAADPDQTRGLLDSGCTAIAYETVSDRDGRLPLLAPMSEVAGRMSVQVGARCLEKEFGGRGVLLGGVTGVAPANVLILGAGVAGYNALQMAVGLQAKVQVVERSVKRAEQLRQEFSDRIEVFAFDPEIIQSLIKEVDLVIGTVLIPGASAPKLVTRDMVSSMEEGAVMVDVSIDQGGCFETSHPTTHKEPTFLVDGVLHYCVANIPGAVPRTSTLALTNMTLPYIKELVGKGVEDALRDNAGLAAGLNIKAGEIMHPAVKQAYSEYRS